MNPSTERLIFNTFCLTGGLISIGVGGLYLTIAGGAVLLFGLLSAMVNGP